MLLNARNNQPPAALRRRRQGRPTFASALTLIALSAGSPSAQGQQVDARELVANAVDLVGGETALRGVERVGMNMMTQWQRTDFREVPFTDRPSFEPHTDVRDYTIPAWRNTREFGARSLINVIRDSIAVSDFGQGFQPLSIAYVDERAELFTYTPDRLLLALLDARDLQLGRDTVIGGESFSSVTATLNQRFLSTVLFHQGTGLPAQLTFRAPHPNDFGLVPWGNMKVEVWYSNWQTFGEISIPTQWDILRVGVPYKRMTVRSAEFNPEFTADSFAVSPEVRAAYFNSLAPKPMHEGVRLDSATWAAPSIAALGSFGVPNGAILLNDGWLLLGAGHTPFNYQQSLSALAKLEDRPVVGVLVGNASTGNGGITRAYDDGIPIYVSPASAPFAARVLANANRSSTGLVSIESGVTMGDGDARIQLAVVDLPDVPGSVLVFHPATGWLFIPDARTPLDVRLATERASALGWNVEAIGTPREFFSLQTNQ